MKKILIFVIFLIPVVTFSQSDKDKALQLGKEGIKLVDNGKLDEGIELFEKAAKLDPDNIIYPYEVAYAYCLKKDYNKSIEICEKLKNRADVLDEVFRLLGNCYDYTGNPSKALEVYDEGIKLFPASGKLYHEKGICYTGLKNFDEAVNTFEKGVSAEPNYPSNYYQLSRIYYNTENEIWALIYAETFINLERNSKRTTELSKLLYDTYKKGIIVKSENDMSISFCKEANLNSEKLLFFETNYEIGFSLALASTEDRSLSLPSLSKIRQTFLKVWYEKGFNEKYNIGLFEYLKQLNGNGIGETYDYYVMGYGDEDFMQKWVNENDDKFKKFETYYIKNKLKLTTENSVFRGK
jgi:tetratricopeptide (TPR) repeat protein